MSQISGQGTTFNLPNYVGELFCLTPKETPFISAIGGLTGGIQTSNIDFAVGVTYDLPAPAQPAVLEGANAPSAVGYVRSQVTNCVQIFHESIDVTYSKMANRNTISGLAILGDQVVDDELGFQTSRALEKIARDMEYSFINGAYARPADNSTARKTRGLFSAVTTNAVAAGSTALTKTHINNLFKMMYDNGAPLDETTVLMLNSSQKMALTSLYQVAPSDRKIGGVSVEELVTDFGTFGVMLNRYVPQTAIAVVCLKACAPVFMPIPEKGHLFREALAKSGSSEKYQIYGEAGLDHGVEVVHGKITGLV